MKPKASPPVTGLILLGALVTMLVGQFFWFFMPIFLLIGLGAGAWDFKRRFMPYGAHHNSTPASASTDPQPSRTGWSMFPSDDGIPDDSDRGPW